MSRMSLKRATRTLTHSLINVSLDFSLICSAVLLSLTPLLPLLALLTHSLTNRNVWFHSASWLGPLDLWPLLIGHICTMADFAENGVVFKRKVWYHSAEVVSFSYPHHGVKLFILGRILHFSRAFFILHSSSTTSAPWHQTLPRVSGAARSERASERSGAERSGAERSERARVALATERVSGVERSGAERSGANERASGALRSERVALLKRRRFLQNRP